MPPNKKTIFSKTSTDKKNFNICPNICSRAAVASKNIKNAYNGAGGGGGDGDSYCLKSESVNNLIYNCKRNNEQNYEKSKFKIRENVECSDNNNQCNRTIERRNSIESNAIRATSGVQNRKDALKHHDQEIRRQSFDSNLNTSNNNVKYLKIMNENKNEKNVPTKIVPSMNKQKILHALQHRNTTTTTATQLQQEKLNQEKKSKEKLRSFSLCFKPNASHEEQQPSNDSRLKQLEEKIRKHKINIKTFANHNEKLKLNNNTNEMRKKIFASQSEQGLVNKNKFDLLRTRSEYCNAMNKNSKYHHISGGGGYNNHNNNVDEVGASERTRFYSTSVGSGGGGGDGSYSGTRYNKHNNNYGVIRATDLFKLRSSELVQ